MLPSASPGHGIVGAVTSRIPDTVSAPRLEIRRLRLADAPSLVEAITASVEHLRPWMPWIAFEPQSVDQRVDYIARTQREWEGGGDLGVGLFLDGRVVGGAGLHRRVGPDGLEIGYWVHVDHVGRGYAQEVAAALSDLALSLPGIERVVIRHDLANRRSEGVPRRLGFRIVEEVADGRTSPGECGITRWWELRRDGRARP
jgi:RimJ/RimL family protein N-acetyltransferase